MEEEDKITHNTIELNLINAPNIWALAKRLTAFGTAQFATQILGMISGVIIIHHLPPDQFSLYTIAFTTVTTLTMVSDAGISSGLLSEGGKCWNNKNKLGEVLATCLQLRFKFAGWGISALLPILAYLLTKNHADLLTIIIILVSVTAIFWSAITTSIYTGPIKLHNLIVPLSRISCTEATIRLMLIAGIFILPTASFALVIVSATSLWAAQQYKRISSKLIVAEASSNEQTKSEILIIVKRAFPEVVFYSISSQGTLWLISTLGSTTAIAQIGALGRINQILMIFGVFTGSLFAPAFSKLSQSAGNLCKWFIIYTSAALALSVAAFLICMAYPQMPLMLIGKNYSHLHNELAISIAVGGLALLNTVVYQLNSARGWIINPKYYIPIAAIGQIAFLFCFDLTTVQGVLSYGFANQVIPLVLRASYFFIRVKRIRRRT